MAWPTTAARSAWSTDIDGRAHCWPSMLHRRPTRCSRCLRTQVDVVLADGVAVLNAADDPAWSRWPTLCDGDVILYGSRPADSPPSWPTAPKAGCAVFVKDGSHRAGHRRAEARAGCCDLDSPAGRSAVAADPGLLAAIGVRLGPGIASPPLIGLPAWRPTTRARMRALSPATFRLTRQHRFDRSPASTQRQGCHPWTFPASGPCAAPTSGAGTRPSKPSWPVSRDERDIEPRCPASKTRLRNLFPDDGLPAARRPTRAPSSLAHVLETAALALQAQAGCPVTFSRTAATLEHGVYQVVVEYSEEAVGRLAFDLRHAAHRRPPLTRARLRPGRGRWPPARARRGRAPGPQHRLHRRRPPWPAASPTAA